MGYGAILLAAGESSRMGVLKALLPWRGLTLVEFSLGSALAAGLDEIALVLGYRAEEIESCIQHFRWDTRIKLVRNHAYAEGKSSSIRLGAKALAPSLRGIFVLAVDQPREPAILKRLIVAHEASPAPVIVPTYGGRSGHPPLFDGKLLSELGEVSEETEGLRELRRRYHERTRLVEIDSPDILVNLNTQSDYEAARSECSGEIIRPEGAGQ